MVEKNDIKNLTLEEKKKLLAQRLMEKKLAEQSNNIISQFEAMVKNKPEEVAFVCDDRKYTYAELNAKSNRIARYLKQKNIEPGTKVCIMVSSRYDLISLFLGIVKHGAIAVPVGAASPAAYVKHILDNNDISCLATNVTIASELGFSKTIIDINNEMQDIEGMSMEAPERQFSADEMAYLVTGAVSEVCISLGSLTKIVDWFHEPGNMSEAPQSFCFGEAESYLNIIHVLATLTNGGMVVTGDLLAKNNQLQNNKLEYIFIDSSDLHYIENTVEETVLFNNASLKEIYCFGDPVRKTELENTALRLNVPVRYIYAPPEAAAIVASYRSTDQIASLGPILGKPVQKSILVLNANMTIVAQGAKGVICIGGVDAAMLEQQKRNFNVIKNTVDEAHGKDLYKTTMYGKKLADGSIEIADNRTRNVSKKGHYLALNEIEKIIVENSSIDDCYIIPYKKNTHKLVAYVAVDDISYCAQLKIEMEKYLPEYMRPDIYIPVARIPLDAMGMLDEESLMKIDVADSSVLAELKAKLIDTGKIKDLEYLFEPEHNPLPYLHISDLITGWKGARDRGQLGQQENNVTVDVQGESAGKTQAFCEGELLEFKENEPVILQQALRQAAQKFGNKSVMCLLDSHEEVKKTYSELLHESQCLLAGLRKIGLQPGGKVIFQFQRNDKFIVAFWGCVLGGFVPVPIAKVPSYTGTNSNLNKLVNACEMFDDYLVLTETAFIKDIESLKTSHNLAALKVASFDELLKNDPDAGWHVSDPEDLALVMLTSGSTGKPKGVMQNHRTILSRTKGTIILNGHSQNDISLNWMPLDHVGGIVMFHVRDVLLGCDQVHVPTNTILGQPMKWLDLIEKYKVTMTWAPNFAYGLVNDKAGEISKGSWDLSSVRFILNAGEAIVARTTRTFLTLLGKHKLSEKCMFPCWGMSETCSGVVYNNFSLQTTSDDDPFVEVGVPIPGFAMRIVDAEGRVLTEGQKGALQVKGRSVTPGYFNNPAVNEESFTDDGWMIVGDLGYIKNGKLTITGREKDVIIINGINYHGHEIESIVEQIEEVEVSFTAACAVRETGMDTDKLAVFFHTQVEGDENVLELIKKIKGEVLQKNGVNPDYVIPVGKQDIPKTEIGKIQRLQLAKRFAEGKFNPSLKKIDLWMKNDNTIPDWFYKRDWHKKNLHISNMVPSGKNIVVFMEATALSGTLIGELEKYNNRCIKIQMGDTYAKTGDAHYCININNKEEYDRCFQDILAQTSGIDYIIHLWSYAENKKKRTQENIISSQNISVYSLLYAIQAVRQHQGEKEIGFYVISSYVQPVTGYAHSNYEFGTLVGFIKTMFLELPWIACRHIDLEYDISHDADIIMQEIGLSKTDPEVAYRNNNRMAPMLSSVKFNETKRALNAVKNDGLFLITGGLGGIGSELAKFLLKQYNARLILVGRTELPDRDKWAEIMTQNSKLAKRVENYITIEKTGGNILYIAADIADASAIQQAIITGEQKWGNKLSGIFHLAGEGNLQDHWALAEKRMILNETGETIDLMLRSKLQGTMSLVEILRQTPGAFLLAFSSVMSIFGGSTFSAYSAANSFLEGAMAYLRQVEKLKTYCIGWSLWDDIGMSENNAQAAQLTSQSMGYMTVGVSQGLNTILAGLENDIPSLYAGLDRSKPHIGKHVHNNKLAMQRLVVYYTGNPIENDNEIYDVAGNSVSYALNLIAEMPKDLQGNIDKDALRQITKASRKDQEEHVAPRNEVEEKLLAVFKQVLNLTQKVSIKDNFFDLGANSILLVKAHSMIQDHGYNIQIVDLFNYTTIEKLAGFISTKKTEPGADNKGQEAAAIAEDRKALMQRRRQRRT